MLDIHRFTVSRDHGFGRIAGERGIVRELGEYYDQLDQALPNVSHLIDGCRHHHLPIVFTRLVAGRRQDVASQARVTGFWAMPDSPDAEFLTGLVPAVGERVIDRTTTSALAAPALQEVLRAQGIRGVIVCGVLANAAVEHTARDAADLGYGVIVVSDACAAETWAIHAFVMTTLVGGLIRTRTTQGVLEMLNGTRT
ncbi:MAG: cysteine hydrolase family protein [Armatimonadota bacterium]